MAQVNTARGEVKKGNNARRRRGIISNREPVKENGNSLNANTQKVGRPIHFVWEDE